MYYQVHDQGFEWKNFKPMSQKTTQLGTNEWAAAWKLSTGWKNRSYIQTSLFIEVKLTLD